MQDIAAILIGPQARVLDAIERIDRSTTQIVLVVDDERRLLGTLTDGDVRRALLAGREVSALTVGELMNRTPRSARQGESREALIARLREFGLHQLPILDEAGRVVDLMTIDTLLRRDWLPNQVVLMAGGLGTRLRPLTDALPKPLLPVGGRPLLETIVTSLAGQGFQRFVISLNYRGEMIRAHFGDGSRFGVEISYLVEPRRMGTAGCLSLLREPPREPFLVMNGDILTSVNFRHLLQFHVDSRALATMAVTEQAIQIPYGVTTVEDGRLTGIVEKPVQRVYVNAGVYVLEPALLSRIRADAPHDMPELFQSVIAEGGHCAAFPIREYWRDIGTPPDLERAESEFPDVFGQ
ncbi:MAG: nucleotidyltransferase family protein [Thalassobaculales bacterium]